MTSTKAPPRWQADLALAGIALIWGSTFVLVKEALSYASTMLFLALRFTLATFALALALRGRYGGFFHKPKAIRAGVLAGLFLFSGYAFQTIGLRYTTPSKSAFLTGLSIVLVPLVAALVYRKVPKFAEAAGVTIAAAGMGLLTLHGQSLRISYGDALTLACALGFAIHIVVVGHYSRKVGFEGLSVMQIATAAAIALGSFWWAETPRVSWTTGLFVALAVTGLLATALAFTVQAWAQRNTTATRTALALSLEPVFAGLTSFLLMGEKLPGRALVGAALILAGIVVVELKPLSRSEHP
ncbi:MAG: DMT family transporter [Bryobacteraceae bacterium]